MLSDCPWPFGLGVSLVEDPTLVPPEVAVVTGAVPGLFAPTPAETSLVVASPLTVGGGRVFAVRLTVAVGLGSLVSDGAGADAARGGRFARILGPGD